MNLTAKLGEEQFKKSLQNEHLICLFKTFIHEHSFPSKGCFCFDTVFRDRRIYLAYYLNIFVDIFHVKKVGKNRPIIQSKIVCNSCVLKLEKEEGLIRLKNVLWLLKQF